jgi:hypothetical protein
VTWIKLDDRAPRHPKIAGLSDRAFRWWVQGLCYASEFLTDGRLVGAFWRTVPGKVLQELVDAGLWLFDGVTVTIHDYLAHQTPRDSVERERERNRQRRNGTAGRTAGTTAGTPAGRTAEVPRPEIREQRSDKDKTPRTPLAGGRKRRLPQHIQRSQPTPVEIDRQSAAVEQCLQAAIARERAKVVA